MIHLRNSLLNGADVVSEYAFLLILLIKLKK